jgi:hypothetical protein
MANSRRVALIACWLVLTGCTTTWKSTITLHGRGVPRSFVLPLLDDAEAQACLSRCRAVNADQFAGCLALCPGAREITGGCDPAVDRPPHAFCQFVGGGDVSVERDGRCDEQPTSRNECRQGIVSDELGTRGAIGVALAVFAMGAVTLWIATGTIGEIRP